MSPSSKTPEFITATPFCVSEFCFPSVKEEIPEDGRLESRMNWVRKAKWMNSGFLGLAEELSRERSSMDKVSVLQQQILTLTEEVKSQKVSVMKSLLLF